MSVIDKFRYDGKRVLVVGGATGMGGAGVEAAKELGAAEVIVMDYAEIKHAGVKKIQVNLADKGSIDAALKQVEGKIDVVFSAAGVADGTPGIEKINFVGHRYLFEKLVANGQVTRGGSVCFISSSAGLGWEANFAELSEVLDMTDFDASAQWMVAHEKANYTGTKQAVCAYVGREALRFIKQGIRINALCPGPTDTPLASAHSWLTMGTDFRQEAGVEASTPSEQAYPMAFLCSDAAVAITGITLVADAGWFNAGFLGTFPPATPIAEWLLGRPAPFKKPAS
jgi:NAD(P)-dependent dehydrogenase (short-subunit alcohol dehydrogenase family)